MLAVSASCVSTMGVAGAEQSSLLLLLLLGEAGEGALSEALQLLLLAEAGGQTDLLELRRKKED